MATYKEIRGVNIQSLDSDPTAVEGDVWYNATTSLLKMYSAVGSWASGGNMNTGRANLAGCGTQTTGLGFGGYKTGASAGETEEYDGSAWTESGDLNTARYKLGGCGTQTAGLAVSGRVPSPAGTTVEATETYDGSS